MNAQTLTTATALMTPTPAAIQASFAEHFAPWVLELGLRVETLQEDPVQGKSALLRLPQSDRLARSGGMLCGQAMMAVADTAMVVALIQHFGVFKPCTTVNMATSFLKPLSKQDALVEARVVRAGKTMAFGEIDIRGADDGKSICRASVTYALL
jgi:uncharacterized protein (TIGR00369 family)